MSRAEPYKVILWGPGYTGSQALREIARRPELELGGCLAYGAAKAGRDAIAVATVTSVRLQEICDLGHHAGEAITGIGFGRGPAMLGSKTRKEILGRYYSECVAGMAHPLGVELDAMTAEVPYPVSEREVRAAVDRGHLAGDPARLVRQQEAHDRRDPRRPGVDRRRA